MKLLLVAPEVCSPWTEGRKNLVRDLAELSGGDHQIELLTTAIEDDSEFPNSPVTATRPAHPALGLLWLVRRLKRILRTEAPDAVFHFPFGTFTGVRGVANRLAVQSIARTCRRAGVPCVTALYSLDADPARSGNLFSRVPGPVVAGAGGAWQGPTVEFGLSTRGWPGIAERTLDSRSILYLAGMWQQTEERFAFVLKRRGLDVLLRAGSELEAAGVDLTVAVPIFESERLVAKLRAHPANTWSPSALRVMGQVPDMPALLLGHSLLVFSYQHEIAIFRPTSVMEAMTVGTVPILSDLPFLRQSLGEAGAAFWFQADSASDLAATVLEALADQADLERRSREAMAYASARWSIEATLESLIAAAAQAA